MRNEILNNTEEIALTKKQNLKWTTQDMYPHLSVSNKWQCFTSSDIPLAVILGHRLQIVSIYQVILKEREV